MIKSKNIGRLVLLKYCSLSVLIIIMIPVVVSLSYQVFTDEPISIITFFKNIFNDVNGYGFSIIIPITSIATGIWVLGGFAGRYIIDKNISKTKIGFMTVFILWGVLLISSTLGAGIENSITYGFSGFCSAIFSWMIYGFFLFILFGVLHGLSIGYFIGKEI